MINIDNYDLYLQKNVKNYINLFFLIFLIKKKYFFLNIKKNYQIFYDKMLKINEKNSWFKILRKMHFFEFFGKNSKINYFKNIINKI